MTCSTKTWTSHFRINFQTHMTGTFRSLTPVKGALKTNEKKGKIDKLCGNKLISINANSHRGCHKRRTKRGLHFSLATTKAQRPGLYISCVGRSRQREGGRQREGSKAWKKNEIKKRFVCSFTLCVDVVLSLVPNAAVPPYFKRNRKKEDEGKDAEGEERGGWRERNENENKGTVWKG